MGLNEHRHSTQNTHLIVKGELQIGYTINHTPCPENASFRFRKVQNMKPGAWFKVSSNVDNKSEKAGPQGCEFVEGHKELSPATADRFAARLMWPNRPTILKVTEDTPGAFLVEPGRNHKHKPKVENSDVDALAGLVDVMGLKMTAAKKKSKKSSEPIEIGTSKDQFLM